MNLSEQFHEIAHTRSERIALIDGEQRYTYAELSHAVDAMAAHLANLTQHEAVGVFLPTSAAFVIAAYGAFRAGLGVLPINLLVSPEQIKFSLRDSGVDTLITTRLFAKRLAGLPVNLVTMEELGERSARGERPALAALQAREQAADDDLAILLYTSGTTGNPKGVRLTNRNIASNISDCLEIFNVQDNDLIIGVLPLFHTFAFTATMGLAMASGAGYITHARFDPEATLRSIEEHRATVLIAIPSMYRLLNRVQAAKRFDMSSLRLAVAGGEPLPPKVEQEFNKVFGSELLEGYGLTETSPVVSFNPPGCNKSGTAGLPLPHVHCKVVDDAGVEVPRGHDGELIVRGPNVMQGYHNQPAATAAVIRNGWFYTGDMARMDEEGYIRITGRKKEMLIVGGENVFPVEVEAVLSEHPGVAHVAVIGARDDLRGEQVKAVIVPLDLSMFNTGAALNERGEVVIAAGAERWASPDAFERELRDFVRDKLPPYAQPRLYEFRAEVPLGPTGKVLKRAL
jgi:long-chain acyl-CoA synthetase